MRNVFGWAWAMDTPFQWIRMPTTVNGATQRSVDGTSMVYTFDQPQAPERHLRQYFETLGNRGMYHK